MQASTRYPVENAQHDAQFPCASGGGKFGLRSTILGTGPITLIFFLPLGVSVLFFIDLKLYIFH
jgi:hypothetical protein